MLDPQRSQYFEPFKTFGALEGALSGGRRYTALP